MKQPIGEFLATLRRACGFTQQEVADKLGISNRTLSSWECGTTMPDILLLPALADLYGVTVDEILRGERSQSPKPQITQKSKSNMYKRKLATFTAMAYLMAGLMCLGLLLFYIGLHINVITIVWAGWRWWLFLLFLGLIMFIAAAVVLFAVWRGNENSADDDDCAPAYLMGLRKCLSNCAYAVAFVSLILMFVAIALTLTNHAAPVFLIFAAIAVACFACAYLLRRSAVKRWGSADQRQDAAINYKFLKKVGLFSMIPVALSIAAIILFSAWHPAKDFVVYSNADSSAFRAHLESFSYVSIDNNGGLDGEYYFNLSQLADGAEEDKPIKLENGFTINYQSDKQLCEVTQPNGFTLVAELVSTNDGSFSAYNLRFCQNTYGFNMEQGTTWYEGGLSISARNGNYDLVYTIYVNYVNVATAVGLSVIALTILGAFIVFVVVQCKT